MEYERIHKVQPGIISPTKLRMKLIGSHYQSKKDDTGLNSNSSRASPSKLQESEIAKNRLLELEDEDDRSVSQMKDRSEKNVENESPDCESNASSSSFEFQKSEKSSSLQNKPPVSRPLSSKWNDAEKWIKNKNSSRKAVLQGSVMKIAPISETKRVDFCEKFSFGTNGAENFNASEEAPVVRSVEMRDTGTEMTPIASQEPSRTATPVGSCTPLRSPNSSIPCSPRRSNVETELQTEIRVDEREKTRKEIVALGVQLGKMNIAAWASRKHEEKNQSSPNVNGSENEKRAAAWEEAEKCKDLARFRREDIQIHAWESEEKARVEAEMRRIEAKVETMRAHAKEKMVKKMALARQRSEEKRAAAEARRNRRADRTAAKAAYVRRTGRMPPSSRFVCCGWL